MKKSKVSRSSRCKSAGAALEPPKKILCAKSDKNLHLKKYPTIILEKPSIRVIEFDETTALDSLESIFKEVPEPRRDIMMSYLTHIREQFQENPVLDPPRPSLENLRDPEEVPKNSLDLDLAEFQVEISKILSGLSRHLAEFSSAQNLLSQRDFHDLERKTLEILHETTFFLPEVRKVLNNLIYVRAQTLQQTLIKVFEDEILLRKCCSDFYEALVVLAHQLEMPRPLLQNHHSETSSLSLDASIEDDETLRVQQESREFVRGTQGLIESLIETHKSMGYVEFQARLNDLLDQISLLDEKLPLLKRLRHVLLDVLLKKLASAVERFLNDDLLKLKSSVRIFQALKQLQNHLSDVKMQ